MRLKRQLAIRAPAAGEKQFCRADDVVECERRRAEAVVLEVEFDRVLAR
jgi:hypothetical protein